jgi:hypothetical protein
MDQDEYADDLIGGRNAAQRANIGEGAGHGVTGGGVMPLTIQPLLVCWTW